MRPEVALADGNLSSESLIAQPTITRSCYWGHTFFVLVAVLKVWLGIKCKVYNFQNNMQQTDIHQHCTMSSGNICLCDQQILLLYLVSFSSRKFLLQDKFNSCIPPQ